jgi:hypothetical protein
MACFVLEYERCIVALYLPGRAPVSKKSSFRSGSNLFGVFTQFNFCVYLAQAVAALVLKISVSGLANVGSILREGLAAANRKLG